MSDHRPFDDDTLARLSEYLDETLPRDEREALETRLAVDSALAAELAALRQVDNLVRETAPAVPEIDWTRFTRETRMHRESAMTPKRRRLFVRLARPIAAAAVLTLIVSSAIWRETNRNRHQASTAVEVQITRSTLVSASANASVSRDLPPTALVTSGPAPRGRTLIVTVSFDGEDDARREQWEDAAALF